MKRVDELWSKIRGLVGDVETPGTLRRQAADLSTEMGDHGVVIAIDHATDGAWMPPAIRYKYWHFFTHWSVLAITRLSDRSPDSVSIPALIKLLRRLREKRGMARDGWIERMGGIRDWRQAKEAEEHESLERWVANGKQPIWGIGPGGKSAKLNEAWNRLTGRETGDDGAGDDMEDWILCSAVRPLDHPAVAAVRKWRNKHVAHQDMGLMQMGLKKFEVFPIKPLVHAYWAVMKATHRVLLLADYLGLDDLHPTPQFSIAEELSGGRLDRDQIDVIEYDLADHSQTWECLLRKSEYGWYRELNESRRRRNQEN